MAIDERGNKMFYTTRGMMMVFTGGPVDWEVTEDLGTYVSPEEFKQLTGAIPNVTLEFCEACGKTNLQIVPASSRYCAECERDPERFTKRAKINYIN